MKKKTIIILVIVALAVIYFLIKKKQKAKTAENKTTSDTPPLEHLEAFEQGEVFNYNGTPFIKLNNTWVKQ